MLEARRLDGFFAYVDLLLVCRRLERTRRVNGGFVDTYFFAVGWLESRWVNSCLVDTYFLTIAWLELGSVLTLSHVNLGLVVTTVWAINFYLDLVVMAEEVRAVDMRKVNVDFVVSTVVRSVDIEVCFGVSVIRSEEERSQQGARKVSVKVTTSTKLSNSSAESRLVGQSS